MVMQLFCFSVDNIDYDVDMNFLKSPEEEAAEKCTREEAECCARMAEFEKDSQEEAGRRANNTNMASRDKDMSKSVKPINTKVPVVDRSSKPNAAAPVSMNNAGGSSRHGQPHTVSVTNNLTEKALRPKNPNKNTNVTKQGAVDIPPVSVASVPAINRNLKPEVTPQASEEWRSGLDRGSGGPGVGLERSGTESGVGPDPDMVGDKLRKERERELLEQRARQAHMKQVAENTDRLLSLQQQHARETAELMRKKKRIQQELKDLEEQRAKWHQNTSAQDLAT